MEHYSQRVRNSILPLSIGDTLPKAFEEWSVTENVVDHETPQETCELCGQKSLRYHFEIRNSLNKNTIWVGSQCILRFGLSVFENGRVLSSEDAKKKISRIMDQLRQDACIRALERVAEAEDDSEILTNALNYFKKNKYLSPKQAFVVLWRLNKHRIDHSPSFFKIDLKHDRSKAQLREMESRVRVLWPALSSSQREIAIRYGHTPPPA